MKPYTQAQIYEASYCLLAPDELAAERCTVAMTPPRWTLFGFPAYEIPEPLTVPFVLIPLEDERRIWMVDLPTLTSLGWVDLRKDVYEENTAHWLREAEQLLYTNMQGDLCSRGIKTNEWFHYFAWQPILPQKPGVRTLAIGVYYIQREREARPRQMVGIGDPLLN